MLQGQCYRDSQVVLQGQSGSVTGTCQVVLQGHVR